MTLAEYNKVFSESHPKELTLIFRDNIHEIILHNEDIYKESLQIEESLCEEDDLTYGKCNASCLRVRVVNSNRFVGMELTVILGVKGVTEHLVDDDGNPLIDSEGNYLVGYDPNSSVEMQIGVYKVDSDKPTNDRVYRDLICYDAMHDINNADVTDWFTSLTFPMTLKDFRDAFFTHLGVPQEDAELVNDDFVTNGSFVVDGQLSGKDVIEKICELNGVFGHIVNGEFRYISLPSADSVSYDWYIDKSGAYEDYDTQLVTGIVARAEDNDIGTSVGTMENPYIIQGNPLIYGSEGTASLTTALTNLYNKIKDFAYRPFSIKAYGNPMLPLGCGVTFNTKYKTIESFVQKKYLKGIQSMTDSLSADGGEYRDSVINLSANKIVRTAGRQHILENNVDKLNSEIFEVDPQTGTVTSKITQMANSIVLKVQTTGGVSKLVQMALSASSGGTEFKVSADNISFIANNKIELSSNSLEINSTNFKVTSAGAITATSGTIGGWSINNTSLYHGGSTISRDGSITLRQSSSANSGLICDYDGIHWYQGSSTRYDVLFVDSTYGSVCLNADAIYTDYLEVGGATLQSLLDEKPNKLDFHGGVTVVTFTNGEGSIPFSIIHVDDRPEGLMVASCNSASILVTYIYDQSTTEVKLWAYDVANGGWYNGDVKVIFSCQQWI